MGYTGKNELNITLFAHGGERKYLNASERLKFYNAIGLLECPKEKAFCKLIYWTGCRPSEALNLCLQNVSVDEQYVIINSLKKRGRGKGRSFRAVPVPREFAEELDEIFAIRATQATGGSGLEQRLFTFSRTTGWLRTKHVMTMAGLSGIRACARGLRHSFGVSLIMAKVPLTSVQTWMGHADMATTRIYLDLDATEDRAIAERMWSQHREFGVQVGGASVFAPGSYPITLRPAYDVSGDEIIRLISAYSAIADKAPRLEFLTAIEAQVSGQTRETYGPSRPLPRPRIFL